MLHMGKDYECVEEGKWEKGVLTNVFRSSWTNEELAASITATYHWSGEFVGLGLSKY